MRSIYLPILLHSHTLNRITTGFRDTSTHIPCISLPYFITLFDPQMKNRQKTVHPVLL